MPAPERGPVHELLERADAVAARCNATRVLADVEKALDAEIEHCEKVIADALGRIADQESLMFRAKYALAVLKEVRRAARGGRDGGGE